MISPGYLVPLPKELVTRVMVGSVKFLLLLQVLRWARRSSARQETPPRPSRADEFGLMKAIRAQVQTLVISCPRASISMSINSATKPALQQMLIDRGETPPARWSKVELRHRLLELEPELANPKKREENEPELRVWVKKINQASAKKTNLVTLCENELGLGLSGNETIAQLERKAMEQAHRLAKADPRDYVGFGKHAGLQYQDIHRYHKEYRAWVIRTAAENQSGCDHRLSRLAQWLFENPEYEEKTAIEETLEKYKPEKPVGLPRKNPGVTPKAKIAPSMPSTSEHGSASSSQAQGMEQLAGVITQMAGAIQSLQEEMQDLRAERPRKKDGANRGPKSDTTSEGYTKIGNE